MDKYLSIIAKRKVRGDRYEHHVWDGLRAFCESSVGNNTDTDSAFAPKALLAMANDIRTHPTFGRRPGRVEPEWVEDMVGAANVAAMMRNRTEEGGTITPNPQRVVTQWTGYHLSLQYGMGRSVVTLALPERNRDDLHISLAVSTDNAGVIAALDISDDMSVVWKATWPERVAPLMELEWPIVYDTNRRIPGWDGHQSF